MLITVSLEFSSKYTNNIVHKFDPKLDPRLIRPQIIALPGDSSLEEQDGRSEMVRPASNLST